MTERPKKCRARAVRRVLLGVLLVLALAFVIYVSDCYHADEAARAALTDPAPGVQVDTETDRIVFAPEEPRAGLIFYPGGKVEYTAYAPLMEKLAEKGVLCVLLKMPLNLAVLAPNAADGVRVDYPDVPVWAVGGHSLGGVMAARYAARHREDVEAVVLLAAYATEDLSHSGLRVLSVYGTEDGVMQWDKYEKHRGKLPADLTELSIQGGCHAWFGSYGPQKGDGTPTISAEAQQSITAAAIAEFLHCSYEEAMVR